MAIDHSNSSIPSINFRLEDLPQHYKAEHEFGDERTPDISTSVSQTIASRANQSALAIYWGRDDDWGWRRRRGAWRRTATTTTRRHPQEDNWWRTGRWWAGRWASTTTTTTCWHQYNLWCRWWRGWGFGRRGTTTHYQNDGGRWWVVRLWRRGFMRCSMHVHLDLRFWRRLRLRRLDDDWRYAVAHDTATGGQRRSVAADGGGSVAAWMEAAYLTVYGTSIPIVYGLCNAESMKNFTKRRRSKKRGTENISSRVCVSKTAGIFV